MIGAALALVLGACAPAEREALPPDIARTVAARVASNTPHHVLVVLGALGDSAMSFATRQALTTGGFVLADSAALSDSTLAVLHFEYVSGGETAWTVRTRRTLGGPARTHDGERIDWQLACDTACVIVDSSVVE